MAKINPFRQAAQKATTPAEKVYYTRFSLSQRLAHAFLLVSFTILGLTGLAQKYATSPLGETILGWLNGIETTRLIHRSAAVVLMAISIYHIIAVLYRVFVLRVSWSMLPVMQDFVHLFQDILFYLGRRARHAYYGRYSYAEKVEYLAVVWGTLIMAITGFMMWNPIATTRFLPGEIIPAAKAAHGGEAVLAVLAIIIWHFYHVHVRHLNKSIFTGKLSEAEMQQEHPAELAQLKAGQGDLRPPETAVRRRQKFFFPLATALTLVLGFGLYRFVNLEETAITTLPRAETARVFVPVTATPAPTPTSLPSPTPGAGVQSTSWEGRYANLLAARCGACHSATATGGLDLRTYASALVGGNQGPAIIPGDADASLLVQVQSAGKHPGQLNLDELAQVIDWIDAGAPEK
jgi:cytochrome b subunit of formate dehydrogenase